MKIGIAQMNTRAGDFSHTVERMVEYSRQAYRQEVDLLVFPMAVLTGPLPVNDSDSEGFFLDLSSALEALSARCLCPCLVPVVTQVDEDPFCEVMLVQNDDVTPLRFSSFVAGQMSQSDVALGDGVSVSAFPTDGSSLDLPCFEMGGLRFGIAVTYDDLDDFVDYDTGVDVLVYVSGYGYAFDDSSSAMGAALGENRFVDDARNMDAWIVGVGSLGGYGPSVYTGSSFVLAPWGELAAAAPGFEEDLVTAVIDPSDEGPLASPLVPEVYNNAQYLWESLRLGLHDYLHKMDRRDAVLVLDGRLDSVVLAVLACDALGPLNVHAVVPSGLGQDDRAAAEEVARRLRIDLVADDAAPGRGTPPDSTSQTGSAYDTAAARDLALMRAAGLARNLGGLVLGSEDKTGLALEADVNAVMAAALMPLGDVYRSQVVELARLRNTISPVIPETSERAYDVPDVGVGVTGSAEARLARVDAVLSTYVEWSSSLTDTVSHQGSQDFTEAVLRRLRECEVGRIGRSLVLMTSSRTLFDARSPLGLTWHDRVRKRSERISPDDLLEQLLQLQQQGDDEPADASSEPGEPRPRDILNFLRDLMQSGHLEGEGPGGMSGGAQSNMSWGGPFSEN